MKEKAQALLHFVVENFGPVLIFYGANHFFGLKPAIAVSTAYSAAEIALKLKRGEKTTGLFKFSAAITLVFGGVDLYAQHSFLFKYESATTNIFTGLFFGSSLLKGRTIIQEFYEKRPDAKPLTRDRVAYFRWLTLVWVAYFFLKAAAYAWVAGRFSIEKGLIVRTLLGSGSMYAMMLISIYGSKKIFPLMKRLKLLPEAEAAA